MEDDTSSVLDFGCEELWLLRGCIRTPMGFLYASDWSTTTEAAKRAAAHTQTERTNMIEDRVAVKDRYLKSGNCVDKRRARLGMCICRTRVERGAVEQMITIDIVECNVGLTNNKKPIACLYFKFDCDQHVKVRATSMSRAAYLFSFETRFASRSTTKMVVHGGCKSGVTVKSRLRSLIVAESI